MRRCFSAPPHFEVTFAQWLANLFIAAPALGQPYVDTSYWSLVIEVVFYAWVALFMALGLFPRRIDLIILVWLGITFANELTIDAPMFEKLFIADDSGFFAVGLLIYEYYRGRRDACLSAFWPLSIGTSVFQAIHKLERLGVHTSGSFDDGSWPRSVWSRSPSIFLATRIRSCRCRRADPRGRRHDLSALSAAHADGLYDPHGSGPGPLRRTLDRRDHFGSDRAGLDHLAVRGAAGTPMDKGRHDGLCGQAWMEFPTEGKRRKRA